MNHDTNNEVARLREKIERQAERIRYLEGATNHACGTPLSRANREIDRLKAELARLAPAPEESVIKESLTTEPVPEWRELGDYEVIQEGDEVKGVGGEWFKVKQTIGEKAGKWGGAIFRTRRPLPKQELPMEKEQVVNYCRKLAGEHLAGHGKEKFYARLGLLVDFATDLYRDQIRPQNQAQSDSESPPSTQPPTTPQK